MKHLLLFAAALVAVIADDLPPSCHKPVFCDSQLLHHVQMARLYPDSKTFVDHQLRYDENTTLAAFQELLNDTNDNPTKEQIQTFVDKYFDTTSELEVWTPTDYTAEPIFLAGIKDESLRKFGKDINAIWPTLGRKVKDIVLEKPELFSLIPVTHGFIVPGGRFKELYYWDAYWIVEGLLISGMEDTVKGMLENFFELLKKLGHIPNGSRWYYQERSQPPLLTAMMSLYIRYTNDIEFLKANIISLEDELNYWLNTQSITFNKDCQDYTLLHYYAPSEGPRPESYYEDYTNAQSFDTEERQREFYIDIKSAAESGWDFSTRWFIDANKDNTGNLTTIHTSKIVPVDLNSIFTNALQTMAYFQGALLHNSHQAASWAYQAKEWRSNIEKVLWNEDDGVWYDYDMSNQQHRRYFYPSNVAPLWMGVVDKDFIKKHAPAVIDYLRLSQGLDFPGGVPSSLIRSGEQWDFPNAWPPLVSIMVNALEALGSDEGKEMAFHVAQTWVRACHKGFGDNKQMFEKYDAEVPGRVGGGGEYTVQDGFGWSNGVVLEFLAKYGRRLTADDATDNSKDASKTSSPSSASSENSADRSNSFDDSDNSNKGH